jgi:hypothetical protein
MVELGLAERRRSLTRQGRLACTTRAGDVEKPARYRRDLGRTLPQGGRDAAGPTNERL